MNKDLIIIFYGLLEGVAHVTALLASWSLDDRTHLIKVFIDEHVTLVMGVVHI